MLKFLIALFSLGILLHAEFHEASSDRFTYEQAEAYCRDHGNGNWRVPRIKELFSLLRDERFAHERSFWASELIVEENSYTTTGSEGEGLGRRHLGYTFYLQDGDVSITPLTKAAGVICTDQPIPRSDISYQITAHGVIDPLNNILWLPLESSDKKKRYSFEEASTFCENLAVNDRSWRLPTLDELYSIVSYEHLRPSLDTAVFGQMMHRYYWSDDSFSEQETYVVGFKLGSVATSSKMNRSYVRCVSDLDE